MRRGERAGHHGGGGELPHALDRGAGFARRGGRARRLVAPGASAGGRRRRAVLHVVPGDEPALAGAGEPGRGRRRGPWPACAPAAWTADAPAGASGAGCWLRPAARLGSAAGWADAGAAAAAAAMASRGAPRRTAAAFDRRAVADEHRVRAAAPRHRGSSPSPDPAPSAPSTSKAMIGSPTCTVAPASSYSCGDHAGERRRQLDDGLGRLHLGDDLVELDGVADRDVPGRRGRIRSAPRRGPAA